VMGIISRIQLRGFRNLSLVEVEPVPGINVISGANGQGKSSLLEAIHYLAFLRSFRTRRPGEMINWDKPFFQLEASISPPQSWPRPVKQEAIEKPSPDRETDSETSPGPTGTGGGLAKQSLRVSYGDTRELSRNGKTSAATDFINSFLCVALVPEDLALVKGTPLLRRRFVDMLMCQMSRDYLHSLMRYNRALTQRNMMLKNVSRYGANAIRAYDHILAESGAVLSLMRADTVRCLGDLFTACYAELTDQTGDAAVIYNSSVFRRQAEQMSVADLQQGIIACLEREYGRDVERRTTRLGPHRDDLSIQLFGKSLAVYGSEGQCRLGALALRLACMQMLNDMGGHRSVVLLIDDVFGELDDERRAAFFKFASRADQVIVTCTSRPRELKNCSHNYRMSKGVLSGGNP